MPKATEQNNAVHSRRNILTVLGSAAAIAAIPATASALQAAKHDPIFAAIDEHKRAMAEINAMGDQQDDLERAIPNERRQTTLLDVAEGDDPRWIAFEQEMARLYEAEDDAECALASIVPTSLAGIVALLEHAIKMEEGIGFPCNLIDDDDPEVSQGWNYFANRNIVTALRAISV